MLTKNPYLSLVLPCYNEAEHLNKSVAEIIAALKKIAVSFEIIFIDDKSKDTTPQLLKVIIKKYPRHKLSVFYHTSNQGRGATVAEGIARAKGKIVGFMDIDCEISPEYLKGFIINLRKNNDIIIAKREYKFNFLSIHRYIASKLYALFARTLFDLPFSDTEAGFKFFRREKILKIITKIKDRHWFWDTEIIVLAHRSGLIIKDLPVKFNRRLDKTSTVNLAADSIKYLQSAVSLKLKLRKLKNYEGY